LLPPGLRVEAVRGIRIVTPFAQVHQVPLLGRWVQKLERGLADTKAAYLAGFFVVVLRKLP
jgi:hypothetical protein